MHRFPQLSFVHRLVFVHSAVHWPLDSNPALLLPLAGFHFKQQAQQLLFWPLNAVVYY